MLSFLHPAELRKPAGGAGAVFAHETTFARPPCVPGAFKGHSPIKHSAAEHGNPGDSPVTVSCPAVPGPLTRAPTRTCPVPCARLEPANAAPAKPSPLRPLPSRGAAPLRRKRRRWLLRAGQEAQSSAAGPGADPGAGWSSAGRPARRRGDSSWPGPRRTVREGGGASLCILAGPGLWGPCAAAGPRRRWPCPALPRGQGPPQGCLQIQTSALRVFNCRGKVDFWRKLGVFLFPLF